MSAAAVAPPLGGHRGLAAAIAVALIAAPAAADPNPKRPVAVLEYRSGSSALAGVDSRLAAILRKRTSLQIIDADNARALIPRLDADVVACAGEGACVARIGAKLKVREVLLVGVSEFGDVILTLQRIDVTDRKVAGRLAEAVAENASPSDDDLAGYLQRVMPRSDFLRFGIIRIDANLRGAEVIVGGEKRGTTPVDAIKVQAPATYDIRLTKAGFTPFRASVAVPPDGEVRVKAELTRKGGGGAWYGRWWVATLAGAVVLGAVGTGVWYSTREPTEVPVGGHTQ
ncbi:MAG: PEGA domain-containing protein [Deltaproteobacteria bacterium]|nr:PEGA domain-containing protein [Deltaproteobacteria bacterium]